MHRLRRVAQSFALLYRRTRAFLHNRSRDGRLALCSHRAQRAAQQGRDRQRSAHPRWPRRRRGSRARRQAISPHRKRRHPDHQADDRQARAMSELKVLSVASEIFPLIKTGGLADVVGALPAALAPEGLEIRTVVPAYPAVTAKLVDAETAYDYADLFGGPARVLA